MLAEGVRFTGDGVYEKGSGLYDATVRTCGTGVCELVCVKVTNTDYLRGKSDMIVDCGSSSCEQDSSTLKSSAEVSKTATPDELQTGPNIGNGANLVVDDSKR